MTPYTLKKTLIHFFILIWALFGLPAYAESKPKKTNTKIYEDEAPKAITAKVKSTRDSRGDTLVYFEGLKKSGPYILLESTKDFAITKNKLIKSSETGGPPVTVSIDENDQILSVTISEGPSPQ